MNRTLVRSLLAALGIFWALVAIVGVVKVFTGSPGVACGVSNTTGLFTGLMLALTSALCLAGAGVIRS